MEQNHERECANPNFKQRSIRELTGIICNLSKEICNRGFKAVLAKRHIISHVNQFKVLHILSSTVPDISLSSWSAWNQSVQQHVDCFLTSCIGFELQCTSNKEIRSFHLWNRLHLKPLVQVTAKHLVSEIGQKSNEDAHSH